MFDLEVETRYGALLRSSSCGSPALVSTSNCCFCDTRAESRGSHNRAASPVALEEGNIAFAE